MPSLHVETPKPIRLRVVERDGPIKLHVGEHFDSKSQPYEGEYEARALFSEQVFPTEEKRMLHDFTVHAINYTEAPNEYGTTVTIGG